VFEPQDSINLFAMTRLALLVRETDSLRGFPQRNLGGGPITISIVAHETPGVEGAAFGDQRTIVLPLTVASTSRTSELRGLMRHELTHIALSTPIGRQKLPKWFEEGFAEWAAGGLSCQGATRINVNLLVNPSLLGDSNVLDSPDLAASRVGYDLFTTFFEFLDRRNPGVNLTLLDSINAHGLDTGIRRAVGVDLPALKEQWRSATLRKYGVGSSQEVCRPA
jgi:hypothetical protein